MTVPSAERPHIDVPPLEACTENGAVDGDLASVGPADLVPTETVQAAPCMPSITAEQRPTAELTDWDWVRIAREGGAAAEQAFTELYQHNFGKVSATLRRMRCPPDLIPDITQETFMRLYTRLGTLESQNNATLATWLQRVAQNLYLSHRRRFDARLVTPTGDDISAHADSSPRQQPDDPQHIVLRAFENRSLWNTLLRLTPEQRQVMYLRHYEGRRLREVGELLGKTEGSAKMLHYRAARRMATLLLQNARGE